MIDPATNISVTLNAAQWNALLVQLAEGPYRLVAPLLAAIQQQCQQYDSDPLAQAHTPPHRVNGGAHDAIGEADEAEDTLAGLVQRVEKRAKRANASARRDPHSET